MFKAFFQAQYINRQSGGAVIAPWDILPGYTLEDWVDAARVFTLEPFFASERTGAIEKIFEKARNENKHYNMLAKRRVH